MTYLISQADGSIGTAATWGTGILGQDSEANGTGALTTTFAAASTTITPGAVTIDALLIKVASRAASPTGTMSVALNTGGGSTAVAGTTVTVNVSDLPLVTVAGTDGGWLIFTLAAPVLLVAATAYSITAKTSSSSQVNLWGATSGNWSYCLRQNGTTNTPSASDLLVIGKEWTAAATGTARSITMDRTSTTAILVGPGGSNYSGAVNICQGGTLSWGVTAATAYVLKVGDGATASDLRIYSGGTMAHNSPPSGTTQTLTFHVNAAASDTLSQLLVKTGGSHTGTGATIGTVQTTLTADVAANASTFTVGAVTGWAAGDTVYIGSTTRTPGDVEALTIASIASQTVTVATGGGTGGNTVKNAHSGTAPFQARVGHLNRNIKINSDQTTLGSTGGAKVTYNAGATVALSYAEFSYLGAALSILIDSTGSGSITFCTVYNCRNAALSLSGASGSVTYTDNVHANFNTTGTNQHVVDLFATSGAHTFRRNAFIGATIGSNNGAMFSVTDLGSTFTDNIISSFTMATNGPVMSLNEASAAVSSAANFANNMVQSCGGRAVQTGDGNNQIVALQGWSIWRNAAAGIITGNANADSLTLDTCFIDGNATNNIQHSQGALTTVSLYGCTLTADASFATTVGILLSTVGASDPIFIGDGGASSGCTATAAVSGGGVTSLSGFASGSNYIVGQIVSLVQSGSTTTSYAQITAVTPSVTNGLAGAPTAATILSGRGGAAYVAGSVTLTPASTFGMVTAHTRDLDFNGSAQQGCEVHAWRTVFTAATIANIGSTSNANAALFSQDHGNVAATQNTYGRQGVSIIDATHIHGAQTTAIKCSPNANATVARPFIYPGPTARHTLRIGVPANPSPTISVTAYVYLSASGGTGVTLHGVGGTVTGVSAFGNEVTAATTTTGSFQALTISGLAPTAKGEIELYYSSDSTTTVFWLGDITITGVANLDTTDLSVPSRGTVNALYTVTAAALTPIGGGQRLSAVYAM